MAVLAERIMQHLRAHGASYTRQLAAALDASADGICRACRCLRAHGLVRTDDSLHMLTAAGRDLLSTGGYVPCQRAGRAASSEGRTLRQRAWNVLRMADHTSVPDLLRTITDGDEPGAAENLRNYCKALQRAGILGRAARSGRYYLRSEANTGPKAPAYNRAAKTVTDRNTGVTVNLGASHG